MKKQGFTLVEMSIVLVIIGLLIGGILVAKDMIATAKVQNFVRQIQQFDVAVENFKTKYNSLPGDSDKFAPAGNNDGIISGDGGNLGAQHVYDWSYEIANFWVQLQQAGFTYSGKTFSANPIALGLNLDSNTPNAVSIQASKEASVVAVYGALSPVYYNAYSIEDLSTQDMTQTGVLTTHGPSATAAFALAVDSKMDDGKPYTGIMINIEPDGEPGNANDANCDDGVNSYTPATGTISCEFLIKMLSQTNGN